MHVGPDNHFHLTYCTNIHPGESWPEVQSNLEQYTLPLKERICPDEPFGVGLRLSDQAARELLKDDQLRRFRDWLDDRGLYVFTLNGFPYGGFHRQVVKDHVYEPDWRTDSRVDYTLRLVQILAALLPEGLEGSISTSPISYKPWLSVEARDDALQAGASNLARVATQLHTLHDRTGALIHIGFEPEPDCLIETTEETVDFFENYLLRSAAPALRRNNVLHRSNGHKGTEEILRRHIRVCLDTCHFAVEFERPADVLVRFAGAGIRISKVQISSALRVPLTGDRAAIAASLEPFAESTYLHQVVGRASNGALARYSDLPDALPNLKDDPSDEWRIHYHVPIFVDRYEKLHSTQSDISDVLEAVLRDRVTPHLEIETYTWDVLPDDLKTDVGTSIEREYRWVLDRIVGKE